MISFKFYPQKRHTCCKLQPPPQNPYVRPCWNTDYINSEKNDGTYCKVTYMDHQEKYGLYERAESELIILRHFKTLFQA